MGELNIKNGANLSGTIQINGGPVDTPLYAEVSISSAQILDMGSTPIELLPAPGDVLKYYEWKVILEYRHNTAAYNYTDLVVIGGGNSYYGAYSDVFLTPQNHVWVAYPTCNNLTTLSGPTTYPNMGRLEMNEPILLTTLDSTNPTTGDGDARAKIWYVVRTLGSEL